MDDFRTLRQLIVGWLLLFVALIPMTDIYRHGK